ncbi:hypothetical protein FOT62_23515 [Serratia marcescens]|uniref:Uncharacterized protein n=1 Tax=Serratia marcescens TaxID=615 RepID=A0A5C7BY97_SERMA|nr:hypothetical protein [Serratia marcescens]TXE26198.1 hypothetical protein FOT62_23515 [Serratia marcescens]TXE54387.1 hypothetical protein FOT56_26095 [Serratia marcescens]
MTITTEKLNEIYENPEQCSYSEIQEMAAMLANREAQPVQVTDGMALDFHHALTDGSIGNDELEEIKVGLRAALCNVTAPPAPAVPPEIPLTSPVAAEYVAGWNACRAAMLENIDKPAPQLDSVVTRHAEQPVSSGYKLPDNVREALTLALQAMEFMGDTLNNIDAVCTEDVEYVTPAFNAVRELLAAAPEGGNDHDTRR